MDVSSQHNFIDAIRKKKGTEPYTTTAEVKRIDGTDIYVRIPGSEMDTCIENTSVAVSVGDTVNVSVSNYDTNITGNRTAPATDDTAANRAAVAADMAQELANLAKYEAATASKAAADAVNDAAIANEAATAAQADATTAKASATQAITDAATAQAAADAAQADATAANTAAGEAKAEALAAKGSAESAQGFAESAQADASTAKTQAEQAVGFANAAGIAASQAQAAAEAAQGDIDDQREWFWHDENGAHVLSNESGYRNDMTSAGMKVVRATADGYGTEVASFGSEEARVGETDKDHTKFTRDGIEVVYNEKEGTDYGPIISTHPIAGWGTGKVTVAILGTDGTETIESGTKITASYDIVKSNGYSDTSLFACAIEIRRVLDDNAAEVVARSWHPTYKPQVEFVADADGKYLIYASDMSGSVESLSGHSHVLEYSLRTYTDKYKTGMRLDQGNLTIGDSVTIGDELVADYVIERGTKNNWSYEKWHSGKLWMRYYAMPTCAISTAQGGTYISAKQSISGSTFAVPFMSTPLINMTAMPNGHDYIAFATPSGGTTSTTFGGYYLMRGNSQSTSRSYIVSIEANGSWK